jgi:predicted protein tyrosine phosphatase
MSLMNRLGNASNPDQGPAKKVLCVCSAGLLRSPTAALVLSQEPYNFNTRSCGVSSEYALIPIDTVLVAWADEIVCMQKEHAITVRRLLESTDMYYDEAPKVKVLDIPDDFSYRDPNLMALIKERYDAL